MNWFRGLAAGAALLAAACAGAGDFETIIAKGKDAVSLRRYAEGERLFERALKLSPGNPEALYGAGICAAGQGGTKRARAYFEEVLQRTYKEPSMRSFHSLAVMRLGEMLVSKMQAEKAIELYRAALRGDPENPELHYGYGLALRLKGMNELALQRFEEALRLNPRHVGAHIGKAAVMFDMGRVPEAFGLLEAAIKLDPRNPTPYGVMSHFYTEMQKPYEADLAMGSYYYGIGAYPMAEKSYRQALKGRDTAEARHTLGAALLQMGKVGEAEENLRLALKKKLKPADPAWAALSQALMYRKDFKGARKAIEEAIDLNPRVPNYHVQLALLSLQEGELKVAEKEAKKALELQPGMTAAQRYLGDVYNQQGKAREAIEAYEKCLVADPSMEDVYVNLGWAYEQAGDLVSARRNYETFLKLSRDQDVNLKVRAQIEDVKRRERKGSRK